jgi:hypothetical protein
MADAAVADILRSLEEPLSPDCTFCLNAPSRSDAGTRDVSTNFGLLASRGDFRDDDRTEALGILRSRGADRIEALGKIRSTNDIPLACVRSTEVDPPVLVRGTTCLEELVWTREGEAREVGLNWVCACLSYCIKVAAL